MRRFLVVLFLSVLGCTMHHAFAQDIHFSQFFLSPVTVGPSASGDFDGDMRFSVIQRRQWTQVSDPLITNGIGVEKRFYVASHYLDIATIFQSDKLDILGYRSDRLYFNTTYEHHLKKSILHFGLQVGYVNRTIDLSEQTFPSQFDNNTGGYNLLLSNNEVVPGLNHGFVDVAAGALWITKVGKGERNRIKNGFNFFHINEPNEAYIGYESPLPIRFQFYHGSIFWVNRLWRVRPYFQYMQTRNDVNVLTMLTGEYQLPSHQTVFAGMGFRGYVEQNDALILLAGTEYQHLRLTMSYDVNVSSLSHLGTRKSAFELSLAYITPPKPHRPKKYLKKLPCATYQHNTFNRE